MAAYPSSLVSSESEEVARTWTRHAPGDDPVDEVERTDGLQRREPVGGSVAHSLADAVPSVRIPNDEEPHEHHRHRELTKGANDAGAADRQLLVAEEDRQPHAAGRELRPEVATVGRQRDETESVQNSARHRRKKRNLNSSTL